MYAVAVKMFQLRSPEASPFFRVVRECFDEFERVYGQRFQLKYGHWRPVIVSAINKFLRSGGLQEGFARVRRPDGGKEFFVGLSCRGLYPKIATHS